MPAQKKKPISKTVSQVAKPTKLERQQQKFDRACEKFADRFTRLSLLRTVTLEWDKVKSIPRAQAQHCAAIVKAAKKLTDAAVKMNTVAEKLADVA